MQRDEALALAQKAVDAWNRCDADGVVETVADDIEHYDAGISAQIHGKAEMRDYVQRYMTAFPDLRVEITSATFEDDRLVQEWRVSATHEGELMGVAPTHKHVEFRGCAVGEVGDDGLEHRSAQYWEAMSLMQQIGAMPAAAGAGGAA